MHHTTPLMFTTINLTSLHCRKNALFFLHKQRPCKLDLSEKYRNFLKCLLKKKNKSK